MGRKEYTYERGEKKLAPGFAAFGERRGGGGGGESFVSLLEQLTRLSFSRG